MSGMQFGFWFENHYIPNDCAIILSLYQWFKWRHNDDYNISYRTNFWDKISSNKVGCCNRPTLIFVIMHEVRGFLVQFTALVH